MSSETKERQQPQRGAAGAKPGASGFYNRVVKRLIDLVLSVAALILLSPLMLISAAGHYQVKACFDPHGIMNPGKGY